MSKLERGQHHSYRDFSLLMRCPMVLRNVSDITGRITSYLLSRFHMDQMIVKAKSSNFDTFLALCVQGTGACFCPEALARKNEKKAVFSCMIRFVSRM